jgi:hypothetical protein
MPDYATVYNTIFDMKCSKCKRTKEPGFFITNGMLYKTCNVCRAHARRNSRAAIDEGMTAAAAEDEVPTATTTISDALREGRRLAGIQRREDQWRRFNMVDTVTYTALLASSSAAAASSYDTSDYFVAEPEPEPEPDDPGL